ncbi:MAG TPA: FtsX-like permease family protein [Bacteroidales bacterium]|nr:FtsX-like permease family protein [Bacteroidales bacterium]
MIRLFFKILWNNRRRNILVFVELFMISLILTNLVFYLVNLYEIYKIRNCYDTNNVIVISLSKKSNEDKNESETSLSNLKKVLEANSFVESVSSCSNGVPYNYNSQWNEFRHDSDRVGLGTRFADIDYAKVMRINPVKGRWFNESDFGKKVTPVLISVDAEKKFFKGNSLGIRMKIDENEFEIIGVTERFKRSDIESPDRFAFIFKDSVSTKNYMGITFLVRTKENRAADMLAVAENQVYTTLNPENWTIDGLNSLENMRVEQNGQSYQGNFLSIIIAIFIMINIFLGTIGILWYNTNLRVHEIGIRRAIGATGKRIRQQLITESMVIALTALVIVIAIIVQTPPFFGRRPVEPGVKGESIILSALIMLILVLLSTWIPAGLASKIQPAESLKTE